VPGPTGRLIGRVLAAACGISALALLAVTRKET
jgi:hypothetical protein